MRTIAVAVAAALVGLAFSMATFERWLVRRRRHELAWSVALAFFAVAAGAMAVGAALGWQGTSFRAFYLFGAIADVPLLALGTVYLLFGSATGDRCAAAVVVFVAFVAGVVTAAPLRHAIAPAALPQGSAVFGPLPQVFAGVGSGLGATVVFGGALVSAIRFRRGRMLWSNVTIATGTAILSASGLLNSVLGEMQAFAVTLLIGISVLFAGFLLATADPRGARPAPAGLPRPSEAPDAGASPPQRREASRRS